MHITYKGDYALKTLLYLTRAYNTKVVSIHEIAREGDMPIKFLEHVIGLLKRGGFVESTRGVKGGYALTRPPEKITLGEVVRFVDGPLEPIACVGSNNYAGCGETGRCKLRKVLFQVKRAVSDIVDNVTLKDLV
jgi:Rrf2 family protein